MSEEIVQPDAADATTTIVAEQSDPETDEPADDADTFPASVVKDLRKESAGYRERAKLAETRAEDAEKRLHTALITATGRLADPSDLTFDPAHLTDADALGAAIDALTDAKPHLKARRVAGDVGQGKRGEVEPPFNLLDAIKART